MKIKRTKSCQRLTVLMAAIAASLLFSSSSPAQFVQPFTQGNVVVERLGNGTASLTTSNCAIFFDEFTVGGTAVQSIPIPSSGPAAMVEGNSTASGEMTLAASGQFICFPGGVTNISNPFNLGSATSAQVPRGVGMLDGNGAYSLVLTSSVAYNAGTMRGVASDGAGNFWASGTATTVGGIYYLGTGSPSNVVFSANLRCCGLFNGNLWYSTGSGTPGIGLWEFPGTPTTSVGNTATKIFTTTSSPYNFSVSPDGNTIFYADDVSGIHKLVNSGGTFGEAYVLTTKPSYGLLVDWSTSPATVYATSANGANNSLITVSDTGAGAAVVTNATAGANRMFRNLSFAPTNATFVASAPSITGISPSSFTASSGGTVTFTLSGFAGNPIASNNWYQVVGTTTNLISHQKGALTLSNLVAGSYSFFAILTNASGSATSSVATLTVTPNPVISAITPSLVATNPGATVTFTLTANPGNPVASNFWFHISNSVPVTTNLLVGATSTSLTLTNVTTNNAGGYFAILTNSSGSATSSVATLIVSNFPPVITGVEPASITTNAGQAVTFTVTTAGTPPFSYFWYKETASVTNFILVTTNQTLTLPSVLAGDSANYQVVASNITTLTATSAVVSLTVTNDPNIQVQPVSTHGLLDGTAQFSVGAVGTGLSYQWYFADANSNLVASVNNGSQATGSTISGANSSLLTIANLQPGDPTNVFVIVTGTFGSATSAVVSLLDVSTHTSLAFWDFNGPEFTNTLINPNSILNPTPFYGVGTAGAVGSCLFPGTSPFSGAVDPNDGLGFTTHLPPLSWGSSHYPVSGGNKENGVQFNVSTVGARNIKVSYESRVSATASEYERLQYTTNGTDWTDYPASSSFNGVAVTYLPYSYDLSGFPGVANNPNFGVRVVTEYQSTATYGISLSTNAASTNYIGTANSYFSGANGGFAAGTVTYDLVTISGDAITNGNIPPTFTSGIDDTNVADFTNITVNFSIGAGTTAADSLVYNAVSLNPNKISPTFVFGGSGANRTLKIIPNNPIPDQVDAAPILVTATDANGDVAASWFVLTVTSVNLAPTNSLTSSPGATNTLANTPITIPFTVGDDRSAPGALTYSVASDNNTLVPAANIVVGNQGTANPTLTITPALNQLGVALLSVTVNDNDPTEPRSTLANIAFMVRPNTNVVAIDYFTYDASGSLDAISAGFWQHLSGVFGQLKVGNGAATVDSFDNTENLQTVLLGAPYRTNSAAVLYASYIVNMDPTRMPRNNGSYFMMFNDGSANTANVEGCVVAATNGAAPGFYQLGIANRVGGTATNAQMFPLDLAPGSNYVVVQSLIVSNGFSTLWVSPINQDSPSVMDTTPPATATNLYNISQFELRESGANAGSINISRLKVGTTFDSIFPTLSIQSSGTNAVIDWSDPTLIIQSTTNLLVPFADAPGATPPYTNSVLGTNAMFFRFKP